LWPVLGFYARDHDAAVYGLQREELLSDQEQEEEYRASGDEEILSPMPASYGSSRDEVAIFSIEWQDGHLAKMQASSSNW
jgi:hypothetical protein